MEPRAGGTRNVKKFWNEEPYRNPFDRDARRRPFLWHGNRLAEEKAKEKNVSEDQILRALTPEKKPLTRGLSVGPPQVDQAAVAAEGQFVQKIRGRSSRSLSITEREEIAAIVKDKPKIDLEINFDYNSSDISTKSLASVQALGRALSSADLKGSTFVVAGHTDAAGGEGYNQDLSERRADAIKRYLVENTASTAPIW